MTNKYDDIFNYATLARSSYADLSRIRSADDADEILSAIKDYDGSKEFAKQVADKYDVLAHYKDRDNHGINPIGSILSIFNSESGFSGTLFRDKGTQEYVMAFKGTDGAKDLWITDVADIVSNGAAHNQIIDMYNFWQQIIHSGEKTNGKPATYQAAYLQFDHEFNLRILKALQDHEPNSIEVQEIKSEAISKGYYVADGNIYKVAFMQSDKIYNDDRAFVYNDKINIAKVTATGHSLGGHLAAIFSRLFPEYTSHVYMFNGAGTGGKNSLVPTIFDGISASDNTDNLLNGLAKGYSKFERDKIYNLTGDKGMNLVAIDKGWALSQPGKQLPIFIESTARDTTLGHGMDQVLDSSAVISLLASLDKHFETMPLDESLAFFNRLLDVTPVGGDTRGTLENVINKISEQLTGKNPNIQTGDRDAFYSAIEDLKNNDQAKEKLSGQAGLLNIFDELKKDQFAIYGKNELGNAYRYALKHLNAFVIPADTIGRNKDKTTISLLDTSESDTYGGMTEEYIRHRLNMLQLLSKNEEDPLYIYKDYTSQIAIASSKTVDYIRSASVIFGTDGDDKNGVLSHTPNNDYIFSGTGNDFLNGGKGSDYLEGSTGHDIYQLKTGDDGVDTIFDSDGDGSLEIDDINLGKQTFSGTAHPDAPKAGDAYYSEDKKYGMTYNGVNWEFSVQDTPGHYKTLANIRHWQDGQLGISLKHADDPKADPALVDFDLDHRNNRNYIVYDGTFAPNGIKVHGSNFASSQFTGSGRADVIHTGDGVLHRVVTGNGGDTVKGGAGREYINAGIKNPKAEDDNDTVYAGDNSDIVLGGAGRDEIWAGNEHEDYDTAVIDYKKYEGVTDPESLKIFEREKRGDWVHGQYGNDTIYGSAKEDILIGGEGFDTIRGGAGKDLILGDADYIPFATSPAIMGNITGYHWLADGTPPRSKKEGVMSLPNGNVFSWQWKTEVKEKDSGNESWDFTISPGPSHTALLRNDRFQQLENGNWNDTIYGGEGDDIIFGQLGDDTIHGGDGDDVLHGDDFNPLPDNMPGGKDTLYGGAGNDRLFAGGGNATMNGGSGNDIYHSGKGNDTMTDESGDDVYWLSSGLDGVNDQGSGYDTYHIAFDGSMISGFTTISDADGKGSITYRGKVLTADQVQATGDNEWRTNDGTAKLTRMGSSLVITNALEDFKGRIIFNGFFNTGESLGLKLLSLDDDNKPNPDPKTQPDPKPQPEQPQAPTAGKPLAAQSVHEKEKLTYTLAEDAFHTANQDDKLTYSARLADGKPLPGWLSFNPQTRTFSGTPSNDDVGMLNVEISAKGKGGSANQRFTLNVINVNDAPQIGTALANQQGTGGKPWQYRLPTDAFHDIDKGDVLSLTAALDDGQPLPSWLAFDAATGQFSGTPPSSEQADTYRIAITATDKAGAQAKQAFNLDITPPANTAPQAATTIVAQKVNEKSRWQFTLPANAFRDPDGDTLSYTATLADGKALPEWLHFDAARQTFSGTPGNDDVGNFSIRVTATDGRGGSAAQNFALEVVNVNDAPQIGATLANQQGTGGKPWQYRLPANAFRDIDKDDVLTLSAKLDNGQPLPSWLKFDGKTGQFSATLPKEAKASAYRIAVTATDKAGAQAKQAFNLDITPPANTAPQAATTIAAQKTNEKSRWQFTLPANAFRDPDGDTLTYTASLTDGKALPKWLHFDAARQTFSGTPGNDDVGNLSIRVTAADGRGGSSMQNFALEVVNVNDAPQIGTELKGQTIIGGELWQYRLPIDAFKDIDKDDVLTLSVRLGDSSGGGNLPTWLTFDAKTGLFKGTPSNENQICQIKVTATDKFGANVSQEFPLQVAEKKSYLYGSEKDDKIFGAGGNEHIYGYGGNDILWGKAGNDTIYAGSGDDVVNGEDGNDHLFGDAGNDRLIGGNGNDRLGGGQGDDILDGGSGNDYLYGDEGNDIYRFMGNYGHDSINNSFGSKGDVDVIEFPDRRLQDVIITRNEDHLIIKDLYYNNQITVIKHFQKDSHYYIHRIRFADGSHLDYDAINRLAQGNNNPPRANLVQDRYAANAARQAQGLTQAMAASGAQPLDNLMTPDNPPLVPPLLSNLKP